MKHVKNFQKEQENGLDLIFAERVNETRTDAVD